MSVQEEPFWKKTLQRVVTDSDKEGNSDHERMVQSQIISPMDKDIPVEHRDYISDEEDKQQNYHDNSDSTPARSSPHSRRNLHVGEASAEQSKENSFAGRPGIDSDDEVNRKFISNEELAEIQRKSETDFSKNVSPDQSIIEPLPQETQDHYKSEQLDERKVKFKSFPSEEYKSEAERLPTFENNKDIDAAEDTTGNNQEHQYYKHEED